MDAKRLAALGLCGVALVSLVGCPWLDPRTNNQGGGDILTATAKVVGQTMTALTPDEVQVVTDFFLAGQTQIPQLTDDEAAAVVDFIQANQLNSIEGIQGLVDNPGSLVIPPSVEELLQRLLQIEVSQLPPLP